MATRKCPHGMRYRKSYTRKGAKRVAGRCIQSQSPYGSPYKVNRTRMRGYKLFRRSLKACPKGYIKRASYVRYTKRGKHVLVPEQCIKDVGLPGKGYRGSEGTKGSKGIGPLRKGELTKHGYVHVNTLTVAQRRAALTAAVAEYGSLSVWRKLNAVAIYTRHVSPAVSAIFKEDMHWIKTTYGLKAL
jgi:hypothetical protein